MKIIAATSNKGKLKEFKQIFASHEIISLSEAGINIDVEENGKSFEENALIKAIEISKLCDYPVLSDDSGLLVEALNGAPGIYSARYAGENATDEDRYKKLLSEMEGITNRNAKFVSAVCLVYPNGEQLLATGEVLGTIGYAPMGENGFGYDPIFISDELNKSFGVATDEEKNSVSHRKRALVKLYELMENKL